LCQDGPRVFDRVISARSAALGWLRVLKTGSKPIGISGPPDPDLAKQMGVFWFLKTAMGFLGRVHTT
jgi:hypothetical protein